MQAVAQPSPSAPPLFSDPEQVQAGLRVALAARKKSDDAERRAVVLAREEGMSWDVIGRYLEMSGETLRRRYAAFIAGA